MSDALASMRKVYKRKKYCQMSLESMRKVKKMGENNVR